MAQVTKTVLKTYFNTGDLPTESNFSDLIDSLQSTLVAGTNIKLASQSNGSVKFLHRFLLIESYQLFQINLH